MQLRDLECTRSIWLCESNLWSSAIAHFSSGSRAFSNVTNHGNFADPVRYLSSGFFGESVSLLNLMLGTGSPHSGLTPAFQAGGRGLCS